MPQMLMKHDRDPKEEIWTEIGDLSVIDLLYAQVLVAVYRRPSQTKSGVLLADVTKEEDLYQGKVGLVVKLGPMSFQDTDEVTFGDLRPKVGDWVLFRASDGWPLDIYKTRCRVLHDTAIRAILQQPDIIF